MLGLSLENPLKDFQNPFDSSNVDFQQSFDAVGKFRINFENSSHFQLTAIFRDLFYRSPTGQQTIYGYGFQFSGRFYLTPADQVTTQLIIGKGISRYITTLSEKGLDAYQSSLYGSINSVYCSILFLIHTIFMVFCCYYLMV